MRGLWRRSWIALATGAALLATLIVVFGSQHMTTMTLDTLRQRGENTLGLAASALAGQLARYEKLPQLIAEHDLIQNAARDPDSFEHAGAANSYLRSINALLGSSDIYLMDRDGTTIAASNYADPVPFVGQNFKYRPYFFDAMAGGDGRFFALGTTSGKRGYYFGAPVLLRGAILGALAFKVDVDAIERSWHGNDLEIVVTDPEGIIFMSGRSEWLFKGMLPLNAERLARTAETRRYAETPLFEMPVKSTNTDTGDVLLDMDGPEGKIEYLVLSEEMADAGWTVSVMLETGSARAQAYTTVLALVLCVGFGAMGIAVVLQNRARAVERLSVQREAKEQLEIRVAERTADLATVNRKLASEVDERRATERQLRRTQTELVQAGKLAALGQMSAALSHEFNQPLAAVRAYAETSGMLLDRGRESEARANVDRIVGLVDRMASISRHLRNFARKPRKKLRAVSVADVVRDTEEIISWRLKGAQVELSVDLGPKPIWVIAGSVRLQQVLVNIISNAADAIAGQAKRFIGVGVHEHADKVVITVTDNGPGVSDAIMARIYDPFFSTKGVGKGLGLGLSISYNIVKDFDGALSVANLPAGGAQFSIELNRAATPTAQAAKLEAME